eukprot:3417-Heterococcus_DN1.PRE.2
MSNEQASVTALECSTLASQFALLTLLYCAAFTCTLLLLHAPCTVYDRDHPQYREDAGGSEEVPLTAVENGLEMRSAHDDDYDGTTLSSRPEDD